MILLIYQRCRPGVLYRLAKEIQTGLRSQRCQKPLCSHLPKPSGLVCPTQIANAMPSLLRVVFLALAVSLASAVREAVKGLEAGGSRRPTKNGPSPKEGSLLSRVTELRFGPSEKPCCSHLLSSWTLSCSGLNRFAGYKKFGYFSGPSECGQSTGFLHSWFHPGFMARVSNCCYVLRGFETHDS